MVDVLKPSLFIGVKYEFWWNLLTALKTFGCPTIYVSVKTKPTSYLWKNYAGAFRKKMADITHIYTQDEASAVFLRHHQIDHVTPAGDTRVVGVLQRKAAIDGHVGSELWIPKDKKIIVYGSIYLSDLPAITGILSDNKYHHIVVPHNVSKENIKAITDRLPSAFHLWSENNTALKTGDIIVVDVIGMLFDLYRYAALAYIGGGFERSVHNTLEAAVFGLPLAFGPRHQGFFETEQFLKMGLATEVHDSKEVRLFTESLMRVEEIKQKARTYFDENKGSVDTIMEGIKRYIK